ncbi:hypothetical protein [Methanobrevibacter sp.]|uniref:hypothetical protein n=1 Tax=Methanobrevibacter sp. TaxID=66852 RepID=UPI0038903ADE
MNFKKILLILSLLVFVFGISAVFSENVTIEGSTFEVPQGYVINSSNDYSAHLVKQNNSNYTIFISEGNFSDLENAKQSREIAGFKHMNEEVFLSDNNISVTMQSYMKNETFHSFYYFDANNASYMIGYSFPVHDESDNQTNPVDEIINNIV